MGTMNIRRAGLGIVLFAIGAAGMAATIITAYCRNDACERILFALGMPGSLLLSGLAQCILLAGGWLILSARQGRRPGRKLS